MTKYEYEKTLVLSTAHISRLDNEAILSDDSLSCMSTDYAHIVMVDKDSRSQIKTLKSYGFSNAFLNIIRFARKNGCQYIKFDCDGPVMDQLTKFDW